MMQFKGNLGAITGGTCPGTPGCPGNVETGDIYNLPVYDPYAGNPLYFPVGPTGGSGGAAASLTLQAIWQQYGLYIAGGLAAVVVLSALGRRR